MTTNFFTQLKASGIKHVSIEMKESGPDEITVFLVPKTSAQDPALKTLKPIIFTGKPEVIDENIFERISTPLSDIQKTFDNIEAFEAQKAEATKSTADKKEINEKEKNKKKKAVEDLKKIVEAEGFNPNRDRDKAMKAIDAVLALDPENAFALKAKKDLIAKTESIGLFESLEIQSENNEEISSSEESESYEESVHNSLSEENES